VPVLKSCPPRGDRWIHEIKFDGWRAQLHKRGERVVIFSRNGHDFTHRFPEIRECVSERRLGQTCPRALPCPSAHQGALPPSASIFSAYQSAN